MPQRAASRQGDPQVRPASSREGCCATLSLHEPHLFRPDASLGEFGQPAPVAGV